MLQKQYGGKALKPVIGIATMKRFDEAERKKRPQPENDRLTNDCCLVFYALCDAVEKVSSDLDRLAGDCRVVDAIYAAHDVRRRASTLKSED